MCETAEYFFFAMLFYRCVTIVYKNLNTKKVLDFFKKKNYLKPREDFERNLKFQSKNKLSHKN